MPSSKHCSIRSKTQHKDREKLPLKTIRLPVVKWVFVYLTGKKSASDYGTCDLSIDKFSVDGPNIDIHIRISKSSVVAHISHCNYETFCLLKEGKRSMYWGINVG